MILRISISFFTFTTISCAQIKKNEVVIPVSEKYKDITADNFVERMLKEVEHFDKEPRYFIRSVQNNYLCDIFLHRPKPGEPLEMIR